MIPIASGVPNIKTEGSAIQTLFSRKWDRKYWETALIPALTTSQYFAELTKGDQVEVTKDPSVSIKDYQDGQALEVERVNLNHITLTIDKAKYFNIALTDVDAELSHLGLASKYMQVALKEGEKVIDTDFFTAMKDEAAAKNKGGSAGVKSSGFDLGTSAAGFATNSTNIVKFLTGIYTVLREQCATGDKWVVIPPWMHWQLMSSELKNAMNMGDGKSVLRTGFIGRLAGEMDFYVSTYLDGAGSAAGSPTAILAGNKDAIAYTMRLSKTEKWRDGNFQTLLQGLMVYGWKCVKPEGLVNAYAYKASEA